MTLWLWFALGAAVAAGIVLWRLLRRDSRAAPPDDDLEANRALHLEKLALLRRQRDDGEISEERCRELEVEYQRQFLADNPPERSGRVDRGGRWVVVVAALLVPVVAAVLYTQLGAQGELRLRSQLERRAEILGAEQPDRDALRSATAEVLDSLSRLAALHPDRPLYPVLLARLYHERGDYALAAENYRKALALAPEDGRLRAEYAQVLFSEAGNRMTPEVAQAAREAVDLDPDNPSALGLLGIAGFQSGDLESAIRHWERALRQVPPESPTARAMRRGIAQAREALGEEAPAPASTEGASLQVRIEAEGVAAGRHGVRLRPGVAGRPHAPGHSAAVLRRSPRPGDPGRQHGHAPGDGTVLRRTGGDRRPGFPFRRSGSHQRRSAGHSGTGDAGGGDGSAACYHR